MKFIELRTPQGQLYLFDLVNQVKIVDEGRSPVSIACIHDERINLTTTDMNYQEIKQYMSHFIVAELGNFPLSGIKYDHY